MVISWLMIRSFEDAVSPVLRRNFPNFHGGLNWSQEPDHTKGQRWLAMAGRFIQLVEVAIYGRYVLFNGFIWTKHPIQLGGPILHQVPFAAAVNHPIWGTSCHHHLHPVKIKDRLSQSPTSNVRVANKCYFSILKMGYNGMIEVILEIE